LTDYPYLEREDVLQALRYAAWRAEEREVMLVERWEVNGEEICARAVPNSVRPVGESMTFTIYMSRTHLIDPQTGKVV
jgi:hypothetical protein